MCFEVLKRATIRADAEPDIEKLQQFRRAKAEAALPKHA